ncbi:hypothetical protein ACMZOO_16975 [Catenovulum sp. SX2]|uniref:hypothetical protein n=1 Tax=Catenovulum sp. SX2 TaxID=3398614 RepID=UPI003F85AB9E
MNQRKKLLKFTLWLSALIFSLIYSFYEEQKFDEVVLTPIADQVKALSTQEHSWSLLNYRESDSSANFEILITGYENAKQSDIQNVKTQALHLICSNSVFRNKLKRGKTIIIDLKSNSSRRVNFANLRIDHSRCVELG